jgi:hypothetical protein
MNYTPTNLGYQVEDKLRVGVHEQTWLNTTVLEDLVSIFFTVVGFPEDFP